MIQLKVNGAEQSFNGAPEKAIALVPARRFGADRFEIWLWRWAVRRMHGPLKRDKPRDPA